MDAEPQQSERASQHRETSADTQATSNIEPASNNSDEASATPRTSHRRRIVSDKGELRDVETQPSDSVVRTSALDAGEPGSTATGKTAVEEDSAGRSNRFGAQAAGPTVATHKVNPDLRQQAVLKGSHPGDRYVTCAMTAM